MEVVSITIAPRYEKQKERESYGEARMTNRIKRANQHSNSEDEHILCNAH
jgi:hypothetical protein